MAGPKDPIKLTVEQYAKISDLEQLIQDYEWELARAREANIPTEEQRKEIEVMKRQLHGIKTVYKP